MLQGFLGNRANIFPLAVHIFLELARLIAFQLGFLTAMSPVVTIGGHNVQRRPQRIGFGFELVLVSVGLRDFLFEDTGDLDRFFGGYIVPAHSQLLWLGFAKISFVNSQLAMVRLGGLRDA